MIDRRNLAKGVAWAAPAITIAAAAPMLAASPSPTPTVTGWADKCPVQPGSDSAIRLGCTCGPMDNGHGHNEHWRIAREGCPMHWPTGEAL